MAAKTLIEVTTLMNREHHRAALPHVICLCALLYAAQGVNAVTVVECVDDAGESFYAERCPPGTEKKAEKRLFGTGGARDAGDAADVPVTLYVAPDCDTCDLVRVHLGRRGIAFTETDASTDPAVQERVRAAAGSLTVPVLTIGDSVVRGLDRSAIDRALVASGLWKDDGSAVATGAPPPPPVAGPAAAAPSDAAPPVPPTPEAGAAPADRYDAAP